MQENHVVQLEFLHCQVHQPEDTIFIGKDCSFLITVRNERFARLNGVGDADNLTNFHGIVEDWEHVIPMLHLDVKDGWISRILLGGKGIEGSF